MQPVSTEELKARGTYRDDRHGARAKPDGVRPDCPPDMKGEALAIWEGTVARLEAQKILDSVDGEYLAEYCFAAAELKECRREHDDLKKKLSRLRHSKAKDVLTQIEVTRALLKQASIDHRAARDSLYRAGDRLGIGAVGRARVKTEAGLGGSSIQEDGDDGLIPRPKIATGTIP